jgi:hypothetical protein
MVVVAALLNPAWRVEIEMDAVIPIFLSIPESDTKIEL